MCGKHACQLIYRHVGTACIHMCICIYVSNPYMALPAYTCTDMGVYVYVYMYLHMYLYCIYIYYTHTYTCTCTHTYCILIHVHRIHTPVRICTTCVYRKKHKEAYVVYTVMPFSLQIYIYMFMHIHIHCMGFQSEFQKLQDPNQAGRQWQRALRVFNSLHQDRLALVQNTLSLRARPTGGVRLY